MLALYTDAITLFASADHPASPGAGYYRSVTLDVRAFRRIAVTVTCTFPGVVDADGLVVESLWDASATAVVAEDWTIVPDAGATLTNTYILDVENLASVTVRLRNSSIANAVNAVSATWYGKLDITPTRQN